jgi:hypothetical protein
MKMILGCFATTILTLTAWPANAVMLCPDDTGIYTPDACDFILPIEPNQRAVDCDFIAEWKWRTVGSGDPRCVAYWQKEAASNARLRALTEGPVPEAQQDLCIKGFQKWERIRVKEFGWAQAPPPPDFDVYP